MTRIPAPLIELEIPYAIDVKLNFSQRVCGIYILQNLYSDRCYLGASISVVHRWSDHRRSLEFGTYTSKDLLRDFRANPELFVFRLIEICEPEELAWREAVNMKAYDVRNELWGYNNSLKKYKLR